MLLHSMSAPHSGVYLGQVTCFLPQETDLNAYRRAWEQVVARHEVFRTGFHWTASAAPFQQEHECAPLPFEVCDRQDGADRKQIIQSCPAEELEHDFDLTAPPLMRLKLVRLPENDYLFVWTHHHLLLDGRARVVVLKEVWEYYRAFCRDEQFEPGQPWPYRDYVEWFYQQDFSAAEAYWQKAVSTFSSPVALDFPREQGKLSAAVRYGVYELSLPAGFKSAVKNAALRQRVTVNLMVQAAWAVLLARYSGQEDIVFGETRACRRGDFPGSAAAVGLLINTVPIRVCANPARTFAGLLRDLRDQHFDFRDHEHLPLHRISSLSGIPRNAEMFNSIVVFEEHDLNSSLQHSGAALWEGIRRVGATHYPLTVVGYTHPEIVLQLHYDRMAITSLCVESMAAHLLNVLQQAVANPQMRLSDAQLLSDREYAELVLNRNATESQYPRESCVHRIFEERVENDPLRPAVIQQNRQVTYQELNFRSNQLAHYLRSRGIHAETKVGICLPRSIEAIIAMLGVLKAGAAYVPLDPDYPVERLAFIIQNAGIALVITEGIFSSRLQKSDLPLVCLDDYSYHDQPTTNLAIAIHPENLAYVMYTSGSTGQPKGVAITHRAILRLLIGTDYACLDSHTIMLQLAPLSFDASTFEIWGALLHGGKLVLYPKEDLVLEKLQQLIRTENISSLWLTASLFNLIIDTKPEALGGVQQVLTGGEALSLSHIDRAQEWLPGVQLINGYGPTEAATFTCCYRIPCPRPVDWQHVPIGTPIRNTRVYVLDREGSPCGIGVPGELYIAGDGLARGYLNAPDLTAERFVPNPLSSPAGSRLYATGDLVRWRQDGLLEFLSRRDDQLKIRGFRIEPGEVEAVLRQQAGVLQAAVIVRDEAGQKSLAAYVVLPPEETNVSILRQRLRSILPEYMMPSLLVELESLPLNSNGKLDRAALPKQEKSETKPLENQTFTYTEEVLAGIWSEILAVDRVPVNGDFFALGGHSLRAMLMIARIRDAFQIEVSLKQVFEHPVLTSLAACIDAQLRSAVTSQLPALRRSLQREVFPVSFAQQRLFVLQQFDSSSWRYNVPIALRLKGKLDVGALEKALTEIARRHEVLRTRFEIVEGQPVQIIAAPQPCPLAIFDLQPLSSAGREKALQRTILGQVQQPFDLSCGSLLRAALIRLAPGEHVFVLVMHHIASDAWSLDVFARELSTLYEACCSGREPALPDLPLQCGDYAVWQRNAMLAPVLQDQLQYWKGQLQDLAPLLLPVSRSRPARLTDAGSRHSITISSDVLHSLRKLSRTEGATLFIAVFSAFAALLHRYTDEQDIAIGTPIAGRNRAEIEGLLGFFVNTLVLRTDVSGCPGYRELLKRARKTALSAFANQDVPFERLVEELHPERNLDRTPLVQVMFAFHPEPPPWNLAGIATQREPVDSRTSKFDLTLFVSEADDKFRITFEYSTDLFDSGTIERMAGHFETLLRSMVADPDVPLSQLPLVSDAEHHQLIHNWNNTGHDFPRHATVAELFEQQVRTSPNADAVIFKDCTLTYHELNERANQLAHYLLQAGVGTDSPVTICLHRSAQMMVALVAILKAGATYVPLDPAYPEARLNYMLHDSHAEVLLTDQQLLPRFSQLPKRVICVDTEAGSIACENRDNPPRRAFPESLAYMIYTSGSTGMPKAVAVTHAGIIRLLFNTNYVNLNRDDRIAQGSNVSFDAATFEIWGALLHGATLVGITQEEMLSSQTLQQVLAKERITVLFLTPALFHQLAAETPAAFQALRYLVIGGDAVNPEFVRKVTGNRISGRLINGYGPTEVTTFATSYDMTELSGDSKTVLIGKPIANTRAYVLNQNLAPAPAGVPGELYLAGPGLARGYWQQPALTAERFVPDPFAPQSGERMYRTGDRVRWTESGDLEFLGRFDTQVKLRGFRVELGEIETCLTQYPNITQAAVLAREDAGPDKTLVAYIVCSTEENLDIGALRNFLRERLPDYMVPSAFVRISFLPLTVNGKIDRKKFPVPEEQASARLEDTALETPTEELLAGIWASVLNVAHVNPQDNFFALGGHSLLSMQIIARVRQVFALQLSIRDLFELPEVRSLARRIDDKRGSGKQSLPSIERAGRENAVPLSFAQERLWFLQQLESGGAAYNIPIALSLRGELNPPWLEKAIAEIIRRHEVLRTTFTPGPEPCQIIHPAGSFQLVKVDLRSVDSELRGSECARLMALEAQKSFDLTREWPLRATLFQLNQQDYRLLINIHHIAADGWSLQVLMRELDNFYAAFSQNEGPALPPLPIQYADYAVWQREWFKGPVLEEQLSYWKNHLAGIPDLLELPIARPRPAVPNYEGAQHHFEIGPETSELLKQWSRKEQVTLFMTLLAAFHVLLHRYNRQQDIVTGTPAAGRSLAETESLIGFFVNTLVLRTRASGSLNFREFLMHVRDITLAAHSHQDLPFEKLVEALRPDRTFDHTPLFQVMFSLQNQKALQWRLPGLDSQVEDMALAEVKFDLSFSLEEHAQGLRATIFYRKDLFEASAIQRLADHYRVLLAAAISHPDLEIGALQFMTSPEKELVLQDWNQTRRSYFDCCLHHFFEDQAKEAPGRSAIIHRGRKLTYEQLNGSANQVADFLRAKGIGPEARVGVCMPRSLEMVICLLGVLKAGGAYVPLDPEYPQERLSYMLQDSGACLLLTHSDLSLAHPGIETIKVDAHWPDISRRSRQNLNAPLLPENIAYVIYTSGSTGRPKGTAIAHRSAVTLLSWAAEVYSPNDLAGVLASTSICFDLSIFELYVPLAHGGTVVLAENALELPTLPDANKVTLINTVPSVMKELLRAKALPPSVRTVNLAGEALLQSLVDDIYRHQQIEKVFNLYGPTEDTTYSTYVQIARGNQQGVTIGRPIANTQAYVLDQRMQPVPVGIPGELYLGGVGLARGYWGRPEFTAEKFVPDMFSDIGGGRLYRTGDLVRYREDGQIEYLGRMDHQVKLRGYRIELSEIESVLLAHEAIEQCVAIVAEDYVNEKRLVCYFVRQSGAAELKAAALKDFLRECLPEYMVPGAFVEMQQLPKTLNGKIDRKNLPAPPAHALDSPAEPERPRTPVEDLLAEIWAEVLRADHIPLAVSFFELGGHSLLAMQVIARIREIFDIELPVRALFQGPTLEKLARTVIACEKIPGQALDVGEAFHQMEAVNAN